ncbi:MAG: metallophosphoesterase [Planctomycetota bacterium]
MLLGVGAAVLLALVLYALAPWLLPVRIREGPLVQMATTDGVTLSWYTTRPVECAVHVLVDGAERAVRPVAAGVRQRVRIGGLTAGQMYPYEIRAGRRPLTKKLAFQTNRRAGERFSFIVFGDSGAGTRAQYGLAQGMAAALELDFLLHTGDIVYPGGERADYEERFFAPYKALIARVNFWPCVGNHDLADEPNQSACFAVFEVPDNGPGLPGCYWFDYASARVIVLDSNLAEPVLAERVAPWLRDSLVAAPAPAAPAPRWKFVSFHHPPYTGGKYVPDARIQRTLVPVLEAGGVDVVFNGHDHNYQRIGPLRGGQRVADGGGVLYVVTGAGGGELYPAAAARPAYVEALNTAEWSFTHVVVDGDVLALRQVALDGRTIDEYALEKSAAAPPAESQVADANPVKQE